MTKYRKKLSDEVKLVESGEFFDNLILGEYTGFYSIDAIFLLNIKNYNVSFKEFCGNFKNNHNVNYNILDTDTFLKRSIKEEEDPTYLKKPKCL